MRRPLIVALLALGIAATAAAQKGEPPRLRIGLGAYVPTIPRDEYKGLGGTLGVQFHPTKGRLFGDLRVSYFGTDSGDDVLVFHSSAAYGATYGRLGGSAGLGVAVGSNLDGGTKGSLSFNFATTYLLGPRVWGEVRYAAARPTGLGGLTLGLLFAI